MKAITLNLRVSNQVGDSDCTDDYLSAAVAAGWTAPTGVTLDVAAHTLSGADPVVLWLAYRQLAAAVSEVGHGDNIDDDADPPCLTAWPTWLDGAAASLARHESPDHASWDGFVAAVPALRDAVREDDDEECGDLHDYYSGDYIRPATQDERDASRAAGPEGVILVRGRSCYVQE